MGSRYGLSMDRLGASRKSRTSIPRQDDLAPAREDTSPKMSVKIQRRWLEISGDPAIRCDLRSHDKGGVGGGKKECHFGHFLWPTQTFDRLEPVNRLLDSLEHFCMITPS